MDTFFCQPRREGFLAWVGSDLSPTDRWFVSIRVNLWANNLVRATPYIYYCPRMGTNLHGFYFLNWYFFFCQLIKLISQMPASLHSQLAAAPNASAKRLAKSVKSELSVGDHKWLGVRLTTIVFFAAKVVLISWYLVYYWPISHLHAGDVQSFAPRF